MACHGKGGQFSPTSYASQPHSLAHGASGSSSGMPRDASMQVASQLTAPRYSVIVILLAALLGRTIRGDTYLGRKGVPTTRGGTMLSIHRTRYLPGSGFMVLAVAAILAATTTI